MQPAEFAAKKHFDFFTVNLNEVSSHLLSHNHFFFLQLQRVPLSLIFAIILVRFPLGVVWDVWWCTGAADQLSF